MDFLSQIGILQKTTKIYEDEKLSLNNELDTRDQRLQRELSDKKRMEQRLHGAVTDMQHKWEKECVSQRLCRYALTSGKPSTLSLLPPSTYRTDA